MTTNRDELFKISPKALCHKCKNIDQKCSLVTKVCDTDSKIGKGYVVKCTKFNMPFETEKKN